MASEPMKQRTIVTLAIVCIICIGDTTARAGPCTSAIAKFETAVRQSAGNPDAGPLARQTIGAQLGYQPTPASIKHAEAKAKAMFDSALARAKRRDARGDRTGCMRALARAEDMYVLP
jgi:hypothetical protein